jgi:outer membrane receptor protein involved in Fe transport
MIKKILGISLCLMQGWALGAEELADTSRVIDLDEVIVVSQPKEQVRLRQQPLSSNAFGEADMQQLNVHDLSQLSAHVPSFVMPAYGSRLTSSMYVRGIGSRINNPAVGVYYDNIPLMSKAAFNNHFYMLDRVDILRGPQGTLYGQNTEGGLVRVYSKNPMSYQGTDVNLGIGTGFYRNVEVAHSHRQSDKLAFSVAGFYSGQDGFFDNTNLGEKNDKGNEAGGKVRLVFEPTEQLKFDWTADYQYTNQNGFGYGEFHPFTYLPTIFSSSYLPADEDVQDPSTTTMNFYKRNMLNTGLHVSYAMPNLLLSSITSYQYLRDQMEMDQDYLPEDFMHLSQRQKQNAVTEEIVLRSNSTNRWQHASGLFGSYQWLRTDAPVNFGQPMRDNLATTILFYMPERVRSMFTTWEIPVLDVTEQFHTPQMNLGLFHESNILLSDRLKATLGFRLNHDKVKIDYSTQALMTLHYAAQMGPRSMEYTNGLLAPLTDDLSHNYTQLLPKIGLTLDVGNNMGNVYAQVAKGYRAGGYNLQMFSDILQNLLMANGKDISSLQDETKTLEPTAETYTAIDETISYKPEESWNYEVGTHLNLFDGRLHADMAFFFMQIRNQQLSVMMPSSNFGRMITNAGKSHSCGLELTLRGALFDGHLDWTANYGFTNAKFEEYTEEKTDGDIMTDLDYKDNYVPFVPQHTFAVAADYHLGKLTLGANVAGQGKTWWDEANTFSQKAYATLGAHADYDFGPVVVSLWGRNLTDTEYNTFAVKSSAAGSTKYFAQRANPLQVGLNARIHF